MTSPIDINPSYLEIVRDILHKNLPSGVTVWVFGSRANWTTKDSSDLDLALEGDYILDHNTIVALEMDFEESNLPYKVDIIDINQVSNSFRHIVEAHKILLANTNKPRSLDDQWSSLKFGDCAALIRDTILPTVLSNTPYIGLEHIGEGTLSLIGCGNASDVSSIKGRFRRGDILFGKLRPYFRKIIRADFDGICSTDIWVVRPTAKIDADFLFYTMASKKFIDFATRGSEGTKMPRAKWEWVSRYDVPVPQLSDQRAISNILRALDDKIKLNWRMNQTLERMARALFKSWFVDFDPVRAKMDGRWSSGESLPGLPAHYYDIFPGRLIDSELAKIPKGWKMTRLRHYAVLNPESWSRTNTPTEIKYVDLANTKSGVIKSVNYYSWGNAPSRAQRILRPGDTIIGVVRPGNKSYALIGDIDLTGSTGFAVLRPTHPKYRELIYLASTSPNNIDKLAHSADGAAYPAISPKEVANTQVPLTGESEHILHQFSNLTAPIIDRMLLNNMENSILLNNRDTLLPKLMSGDLQITLRTDRGKR